MKSNFKSITLKNQKQTEDNELNFISGSSRDDGDGGGIGFGGAGQTLDIFGR